MQDQDFEQLGVFYLGRPYDLEAQKHKDGLLLYDSKDLVTHAVCIGMTGSGKTGLCLSLIEEALIDGIPTLIIDPKGDLANLLLTFPKLQPDDFAQWVNEDDARRKGLSVADYAAEQAALWKQGLADWGQSGERIKRLRDAADFTIYTPGSQAGVPVSILRSFAAPPHAVAEDSDLLRERISTTATSMLGLLGIETDPLRSREHILISNILEVVWKQGDSLDIPALIHQIQTPPLKKIGALDIEAFYPAADRFTLAMQLNNLLAAPGFDAWLKGVPLDIDTMLHTTEGKPRASIFSIAHLSDTERMFFVSLLLNQTLGWMRVRSGTNSLRAILYMDEVFGYLPPVANPPSKQPLLTLLKQARSFGLGIVLATQNPVDLDYKALANTGTWFIGRLQTERDKARVLAGLEGAATAGGTRFDRQHIERMLGRLGKRVFLLNNVHEDAPEVFETRWALSYLRGPLTRDQIRVLMEPRKQRELARPQVAATPSAAGHPLARGQSVDTAAATEAPLLPPQVPQYFLPVRSRRPEQSTLLYRGMILGTAEVRFVSAKLGVDVAQQAALLAPVTDDPIPVDWEKGTEIDFSLGNLDESSDETACYAQLPSVAGKARNYQTWSQSLVKWLYAGQQIELLKSPATRLVSKPGEPERDFRIRLKEAAREERDRWAEEMREKYAKKAAALDERLRRAQQALERERAQVKQQGLQAVISAGATLLSAFLGRKTVKVSTVGRATTAARGVGRVLKEKQDVGRARETVAALERQVTDLDAEFRAEMAALETKANPLTESLEIITVKPKKRDISVRLVTLAWVPHWQDSHGDLTAAWL